MPNFYVYIDIIKHSSYRSEGVDVKVSRLKEIVCKDHKNTGFKSVTHTFTGRGAYTLKFINNYITSNQKSFQLTTTIPGVVSSGVVHVYFYGNDPRPLIACYNKQAYIPKKGSYDSKWIKETSISKCECKDGTGDNEELLKALTEVVGFLNEVDLSKHPPATNGKCNTGSRLPGSSNSCATSAGQGSSSNSCTYVVHTYQKNKVTVKVKVTCEALTTNGDGNSCYRKLIHEPAGINGKGSGFRLGDIVYNNGSGKHFTVPYTDGEHKFKPVIRVEAYFYEGDIKYQDPLLAELVFSNGSGGANVFEYYKLIMTSGSGMVWQKDPDACEKVKENSELAKYLDEIRYELKKVLKVDISCQHGYPIQLSKQPGNTKSGFEQLQNGGGKTITVEECNKGVCSKLKDSNYKCVVHRISQLGADVLHKIGGLAFTIPGQDERGRESDKVIQLYEDVTAEEVEALCEPGQQIKPLIYNKCMGDIYVYFYGSDPRPLMLCYEGKAYSPIVKELYFEMWVQDRTVMKCECTGGGSCDCDKLLKSLTTVVGFLNQVDLSKHPTGSGNGCINSGAEDGTSTTCKPTEKNVDSCTYDVDTYKGKPVRVKVTCSDIKRNGTSPSSNGTSCYKKLTHVPAGMCDASGQTSEPNKEFRLGDVTYPNGDSVPFKVPYYDNGPNQSTNKYKPLVKVEAYFYGEDKCYRDPLLVVLEFKNNGVDSVNGKTCEGNVCDYYKLESRSDDKVTWEQEKKEQLSDEPKLLDYLNELRYGFKKIIRIEIKHNTPSSKYPLVGREGKAADNKEFKPITGSNGQVNVTVQKCEDVVCEKLKETNYKCFQHKLSSLSSNEHHKIGGLTFYIPNKYGREVELELRNGEPSRSKIERLFYNKCMGDIYVYFYGQDPRPLLFCYGKEMYRPKNMYNYFRNWAKDSTLQRCDCKGTGGCCDGLLKVLIKVSNLLNPLNIKVAPRYDKTIRRRYVIHKFNGQDVKIKVEKTTSASNSFCYNGYTHTHFGIDCKGEGFRLGNIRYRLKCILLKDGDGSNAKCITSQLDNGDKYNAASKVVVFYYQGDKQFERPLLVALCNNSSKDECKVYYELQNDGGKGSGVKKYTQVKNGTSIKVDDTRPEGELAKKLDNIRYTIAKHLQIILDKKSTYCCKMYEKTNGYKEVTCQNKEIQIGNPTDVKLEKGQKSGYKCYEHNLLKVENVDQIGGLKFYLWDNTEGSGSPGSSSQGRTECGTTSSSPGGAGCTNTSAGSSDKCKELCLYKECPPSSGESVNSSCAAAAVTSPSTPSCSTAPGQASQHSLVTTSYTTCKGNVYVFFYGDDPRPLMMCYDGNAYGPRCKDEYECYWVCLAGVKGCGVDGKCTGLASESILKALYGASMFLNPVKLGLTRCAYKQGKPPYKYEVHTYNTTCVKIAVSPTDLSCYRQYVHKPEKEGFRLGQVSYVHPSGQAKCSEKAKCPDTSSSPPAPASTNGCTTQTSNTTNNCKPFCFEYCQSKQLIGVSLYYYMYDKSHQYPLIVELQFKGEVSDYYRLACKGNGNKCKTWVRMTDKPSKGHSCCKNGPGAGNSNCNDACKDNQGGSCQSTGQSTQKCTQSTTDTDDDICKLDADFARNAKRIEERILGLHMASEVDQVEFMAWTAELIAWIERRAYQIRKALDLKWNSANLIMETDENCHEESMLMYLVGGGAVGVAGGGGWKAMVFFLGLFVKL